MEARARVRFGLWFVGAVGAASGLFLALAPCGSDPDESSSFGPP